MSIDLSTVIWSFLNFFLILFVLYKFGLSPVLNFLDNRSEGIAKDISDAEDSRNEAAVLLQEYQEKIAGAREEAQDIIAKANKVAEGERAELLAQTREETASMLEKARQEIRLERDRALKDLRQEVSTLAVMGAEKILRRNINAEDNMKMVDDFLSEAGEIH